MRSPLSAPGRDSVQQAVDDLGGAECLALDLLEQHRPRIQRIGALEQHLREARDAGQRRVDFVRDAGRQQADRRHLLRDLQLLLEPDAVGHVLEQQNRARPPRPAPAGTLQRHRRRVDQQPARSAIAGGRRRAAVSGTLNSVAPRGFSCRAARSASTNGASKISDSGRPDRIGPLDAVEGLERVVPADDALVGVEHHQTVVERFEDVVVELAHPPELLGLEMELTVEPAVLDRRRDLPGDRGQQREILAVERLVGLLAARAPARRWPTPSKMQGTK